MLPWIGRFFDSSIGKKATMAVTGLLLVGFLVLHLAGNLLLFEGPEGTGFGAYAQKLHDLGPLLLVAELGLVGLFTLHIGFALRTILENRKARGTTGGSKYAVAASHGGKTLASASMPITGAITLGFLIVHLLNFRFDAEFKSLFAEHAEGSEGYRAASRMVIDELSSPLLVVIYLVGVAALTLHLSHGIRSALQTLGVNHPQWNAVLRPLALVLAIVLGLGFASLPIFALLS